MRLKHSVRFRLTLSAPSVGWYVLIASAAFCFLVSVYVRLWTPEYGLTRMLFVGREFNDRGTAVFRATPKYIDPYPAHRWGFDGQLYAEMALDPLLRDPQYHVALDDPLYRARRILLPALAWVLGAGRPVWILNAYSTLNLLFWVGFAWLAARLFRPYGWGGLAGYAAMLLTCGIIECIQASLTDFPAFVLITAALVRGGTAGAGLLGLATLAREPSLLGFAGLLEFPPPWKDALKKNLLRGLIVTLPFALWFTFVLWRFRGRDIWVAGDNLDFPFRAMMEKLGEFSVKATDGSIRWHRWIFELYKSEALHALLTIVTVLTQTVFLFLHREWHNRLWRWAAVVAVYFSCISFLSWESHFTVTRHALPMTLVFNLLLAARPRRGWLVWFLLGNCFVPLGIHTLWILPEVHSPKRPPEFTVAAASPGVPVRAVFDAGWSPQQWTEAETWRWANEKSSTIILRNESQQTARVRLQFLSRVTQPRQLWVQVQETTLLQQPLKSGRHVVVLPPLSLPPGETQLRFQSSEPPTPADDDTPGEVTFMVGNPILTVEATPASGTR